MASSKKEKRTPHNKLFWLLGVVSAISGPVGPMIYYATKTIADKLNTREDPLSPEEQAKILNLHRTLIKIEKFNFYEGNQFAKFMGEKGKAGNLLFEGTNVPGFDKFHDQIKADPSITSALDTALKASPEIEAAQQKFDAAVHEAKNQLKSQEVEKAIDTVTKSTKEAEKAIKAQHTVETKALEELFKQDPASKAYTNEFVTHLKSALNPQPVTDAAIENIKKSMIDDLKRKQEEQLHEFNRASAQAIVDLYETFAQERLRIAILATTNGRFNIKNPAMNPVKASVRTGRDDEPVNVEISELLDYSNLSRRRTTFALDLAGLQTGTLHFDKSMLRDPSSYAGNQVEQDMTLMVLTIKAGSKPGKGIDIDVNVEPIELAEVRAMQMYAACRKAGYPDDKINIVVKGKGVVFGKDGDVKIKENDANYLFKGKPEEKARIEAVAKDYKEKAEKQFPDIAEYRSILEADRAKQKEKEATKAPSAEKTSQSTGPANT
jgi:hypothetical protein